MKPPQGIPSIHNGMPFRWAWPYLSASGETLGFDVRYESQDGDGIRKAVLPFLIPNGSGFRNGIQRQSRQLYAQDILAKAPEDAPIFIVEGAKCAAAMNELGLPTTTSPGGSGAAHLADWTPVARFNRIYILLDNDAAGEKYGNAVVAELAKLPGSRECFLVRLPRLPEEGGDIVDWLKVRVRTWDGYGPVPREAGDGLVEELLETIKECSKPVSAIEVEAGEWPKPEPLPDSLAPVAAFEPALLPEVLRPWIEDIGELFQCPLDYPAVGAMVVAASVVGRQVCIRPKARADWTVVPNLWGAIVAPPSRLKTPALQEPMGHVLRLEVAARERYEEEMEEYEAQKLVSYAHKKRSLKDIEKAVGNSRIDAMEKAREAVKADHTTEPCRRRYVVNDSTVEKLGVLLSGNPNGLLLFRDELSGFLQTLDKQGHEGARAFYLESWDGKGRFTYDRIERGTVEIESATVSILGGIQPGPLSQYLRGTLKGGVGDDGLMQRFQLLAWPDAPSTWRNVDRRPDAAAKNAVYARLEELADIKPEVLGATQDGDRGIPFFRFDFEAQQEFDEWHCVLEHRLLNDEEHPAIISHLGKYRSLVPSLALLIHLIDGRTGPVGVEPLKKALGWAKYLESHARRVYSAGITADVETARTLYRRILKGDVPSPFGLRDVYRKHWSGLGTKEEAKAAVDMLEDFNIVVRETVLTHGRSATTYTLNPRARDMK